jgi:hypothetical protein
LIRFIYTIHTHLIFYKSPPFWRKKTNKILFRKQIYHFTFQTQNATIQLQMLETSEVIRIYNMKCYYLQQSTYKNKNKNDYPQIKVKPHDPRFLDGYIGDGSPAK